MAIPTQSVMKIWLFEISMKNVLGPNCLPKKRDIVEKMTSIGVLTLFLIWYYNIGIKPEYFADERRT